MTTGSQVTGHQINLSDCRPVKGAGEPVTCLHCEDEGLLAVQGSVQLQCEDECLAPANHQLRARVLPCAVGSTVPQLLPVHLGDFDP